MATIAEIIEAAKPELASWVGRKQVVEDEIGLTTVRRIAAMLDQDPMRYVAGTELPPTWFSMFFNNNAMQRDIGSDGHPNKGIFLPPIPLPRRMGAGRRLAITGTLRAGMPGKRTAEVLAITPKVARTGHLVVLTLRHTIESEGRVIAVDDFDAVYREGLKPGEKNPLSPLVAPPADPAWTKKVHLSEPLVFRYSAITWNAHRIHYDADYSRDEEGYTHTVQNGGLTQQLIFDAAMERLSGRGRLLGLSARLSRPLWVGDSFTIAGGLPKDGRMSCWGIDKDGALCANVEVEYQA